MTPRNPEAGRLDFVKEKPSGLRKVWNVIKYPLLLAGMAYGAGAIVKNVPGMKIGGMDINNSFVGRNAGQLYSGVNDKVYANLPGPVQRWVDTNIRNPAYLRNLPPDYAGPNAPTGGGGTGGPGSTGPLGTQA